MYTNGRCSILLVALVVHVDKIVRFIAGQVNRFQESFDLTGNSDVRQALRNKLMESKNHHTVIAPAVVAQLLWCFFDEDRELPGADRHDAGY